MPNGRLGGPFLRPQEGAANMSQIGLEYGRTGRWSQKFNHKLDNSDALEGGESA